MKQKENGMPICRLKVIAAALMTTFVIAQPAYAGSERESLETLRQTTLNLIGVLVEQGVMTREKADSLVRAAEQKAAETVAAEKIADAGKAEVSGDAVSGAKGRIRVPYIPETVRNEIREQIKQEVLAQSKSERWGDPGALPDWLSRITWEGDIRLRYQSEMLDSQNAPANDYALATLIGVPSTTRAADFGSFRGNVALANTLEDRQRLRVRARLGMLARISDDFSTGFRLATGNTSDRVSTNQSLGQNFNKASFLLDRAYLKYEPMDWISVSGGRIPNPWFSTDLVWDDDLNFEGVAATFGKRKSKDVFQPFLTVGAFPLREDNPPTRTDRWMHGAQAGFQWSLSEKTRLKVGAAYYGFKNLEGRPEADDSFVGGVQQNANYGQYEYDAGLRQKGNTLFLTNAVTDPNYATTPFWGLASKFRVVNLTAALDLAQWDPSHLTLIGDYVTNIAHDKTEIYSRTGLTSADMPDGRNSGYLVKLQLGQTAIKERNDWNASIAYRYLGSDAVLDAFTDSDFGLGGTNTKGYILGLNYGLDRNVSLGMKWISADAIDSMIPISQQTALGFSAAKARFSLDLFQVDLSAKF